MGEQIIIDGVYINACLVSEKCKEFETCNIKNILRQLARKTQECDTLKSQLDFEVQQKECIEQECEELKESVDKIKNYVKNQMFDVDCKNWFDRFIYTFEDWKKSICEANDRYRKALEEIGEIVKQTCRKRCTNDCLGTRKHCGYGAIFNIISKAKGEGNGN